MKYKVDLKFEKEEFKDFYKKLGYNLNGPKFKQDQTKLYKEGERRYKLANLKYKLKRKLRKYAFYKFLLHDDAKIINEKLSQATDYFDFIVTLDWETINEMIDKEAKVYYKLLSHKKQLIWFKKFLKKLHLRLLRLAKRKAKKARRALFRPKRKLKLYKLILKHTDNNFFVIFTTVSGRVLWYCTSGQVCTFFNIKRKRSHFLVKDMMQRLRVKLRSLRVKYVAVFIRSNLSRHIQKVFSFLDANRIIIKYVVFNRPLPHHFGKRMKKPRRI